MTASPGSNNPVKNVAVYLGAGGRVSIWSFLMHAFAGFPTLRRACREKGKPVQPFLFPVGHRSGWRRCWYEWRLTFERMMLNDPARIFPQR